MRGSEAREGGEGGEPSKLRPFNLRAAEKVIEVPPSASLSFHSLLDHKRGSLNRKKTFIIIIIGIPPTNESKEHG